MKRLKTAIYARYSTDKQRESSIEDQFRICQLRAEKENFEIIKYYSDDAIGGSTPLEKRLGSSQLLSAINANYIEALIVEGLDRISRDQVEQERIVRRLEHDGIVIIGIADGYDSRMGHSRKILRGIRGLINELYLDDLSHKTHRGQQGQVTRGYTAGGRSYGYQIIRDKHGSRFEILEEEANWVRWIFRKYGDGWSIQRIARSLNESGAPSPRGKSWAVSAIYGSPAKGSGILNNKLYIGQYIWNRSRWIKDPDTGISKRISRPISEWTIVDTPQLRIVTDEQWKAVRLRMDDKSTVSRGRPLRTLFGGLMRCPKCGGPIIATSQRYYGCNLAKDRGPTVCSGFYIPREETEECLLSMLQEELLSVDAQKKIKSQIKVILNERHLLKRQLSSSSQTQLTKINTEIERLVDAIVALGISPTLQSRLQAAEAKREEIIAENLKVTGREISVAEAIATVGRITADLKSAMETDPKRSREIISELMGNIALTMREDGIYVEHDAVSERLVFIASSGMSLNGVAGAGFEPTTSGL